MAYMVVHLAGNNEIEFPLDKLPILHSELNGIQDREAYVAVTHESEWCLSINPFGLLIWENNRSDLEGSWYQEEVSKDLVLDLWKLLSEGNIKEIQNQSWLKGDPIYGI